MLITQGSPEHPVGASGGSYSGHGIRFGQFEFSVVAEQNRLVQEKGTDGSQQGSSQINIASFENPVSFAPVLVNTRVIATTDQTTATKDLFGMGVMTGITDGGG